MEGIIPTQHSSASLSVQRMPLPHHISNSCAFPWLNNFDRQLVSPPADSRQPACHLMDYEITFLIHSVTSNKRYIYRVSTMWQEPCWL